MRLHKISITGFKSHSKTVVLSDLSNFNAITGRNGTGKSNILDAILFGLCFDANIRTRKLVDLINSKCSKCSVTLYFYNNDKRRCLEIYRNRDEITVSRSLDHTNKSRFMINNTNASIKTVKNLYDGFGLIPSNFSIVLQGAVTKVIDRNVWSLILEASGLNHYETEKKKALSMIVKKEQELARSKDTFKNVIGPVYKRLLSEREAFLAYQKHQNTYTANKRAFENTECVLNYNDIVNKCKIFASLLEEIRSINSSIKELILVDIPKNDVLGFKNEQVQEINRLQSHQDSLNELENEKKAAFTELVKAISGFYAQASKLNPTQYDSGKPQQISTLAEELIKICETDSSDFGSIKGKIPGSTTDSNFIPPARCISYLEQIFGYKSILKKLSSFSERKKALEADLKSTNGLIDASSSFKKIEDLQSEIHFKTSKLASQYTQFKILCEKNHASMKLLQKDLPEITNDFSKLILETKKRPTFQNAEQIEFRPSDLKNKNLVGDNQSNLNEDKSVQTNISAFFTQMNSHQKAPLLTSIHGIQKFMDDFLKCNLENNFNSLSDISDFESSTDCILQILLRYTSTVSDITKIHDDILSTGKELFENISKLDYPFFDGVYGKVVDNFVVKNKIFEEAIFVCLSGRLNCLIVRDDEIASRILNNARCNVIPLNKIKGIYNKSLDSQIKEYCHKKRPKKITNSETLDPKITDNGRNSKDGIDKNTNDSVNDSDHKLTGTDSLPCCALELLEFPDHLKNAFEFACGNYYVFESSEMAKDVCFRFKVPCVTLNGNLYDPRGIITGGKNTYRKSCGTISRINVLQDSLIQKFQLFSFLISNIFSEYDSIPFFGKTFQSKASCSNAFKNNFWESFSRENVLKTYRCYESSQISEFLENFEVLTRDLHSGLLIVKTQTLEMDSLRTHFTQLNDCQQTDKNKIYLDLCKQIGSLEIQEKHFLNTKSKILECLELLINIKTETNVLFLKITETKENLEKIHSAIKQKEVCERRKTFFENENKMLSAKRELMMKQRAQKMNTLRKYATFLSENLNKKIISNEEACELFIQIIQSNYFTVEMFDNEAFLNKSGMSLDKGFSKENQTPDPHFLQNYLKSHSIPSIVNTSKSLNLEEEAFSQSKNIYPDISENQNLKVNGSSTNLSMYKNDNEKTCPLAQKTPVIDGYTLSNIIESLFNDLEIWKDSAVDKLFSLRSRIFYLCSQTSFDEDIHSKTHQYYLFLENNLQPVENPKTDPRSFVFLEKHEENIKLLESQIKKCDSDKAKILRSIDYWNGQVKMVYLNAFDFLNRECRLFLQKFIPDSDVEFVMRNKNHVNHDEREMTFIEMDKLEPRKTIFYTNDKVDDDKEVKELLEKLCAEVPDDIDIRVKIGHTWRNHLKELSGGQRSIIALCMILTMLRYNPAPIYLFDEIDSALDEQFTSGIGEAVKMFNAQFIVVSLKNSFYTNATSLYQVVAEDDGTSISKLR